MLMIPVPQERLAPNPNPDSRAARSGVLVALWLTLCLLGCASTAKFHVRVDGMAASSQPDGRRYVLIPAAADRSASDLEFLEFARSVEAGLAERGFERAASAGNADLVVAIDWSVGDPVRETIVYPRPAFSYFDSFNHHHVHGRNCGHGVYGRSSFDRGFGYEPLARTFRTFNRVLELWASEIESNRPLGSGRPLWSTRVESRGGDDDLRRVLPVLVGAAAAHLATDTGERIEMTVREDDERVDRIKLARQRDGTTRDPSGDPVGLTPILEGEPEPQ
jgi:hypothetical protein